MQDKFHKPGSFAAAPQGKRLSSASERVTDTCSRYDVTSYLYDAKTKTPIPIDPSVARREATQVVEKKFLTQLLSHQGTLIFLLQFIIKFMAILVLYPFFFCFYLLPKWLIIKPLMKIRSFKLQCYQKLKNQILKLPFMLSRVASVVLKPMKAVNAQLIKGKDQLRQFIHQSIGFIRRRKLVSFSFSIQFKTGIEKLKSLSKSRTAQWKEFKYNIYQSMRTGPKKLLSYTSAVYSFFANLKNRPLDLIKRWNDRLNDRVNRIRTPLIYKKMSSWFQIKKDKLNQKRREKIEKLINRIQKSLAFRWKMGRPRFLKMSFHSDVPKQLFNRILNLNIKNVFKKIVQFKSISLPKISFPKIKLPIRMIGLFTKIKQNKIFKLKRPQKLNERMERVSTFIEQKGFNFMIWLRVLYQYVYHNVKEVKNDIKRKFIKNN